MIFHAEADGPGIEGVSFWMERRIQPDGSLTRRYMLAGDGLESKPLATKQYPDPGGEFSEDIEMLVQGFTFCIFIAGRKIQIKGRTKPSRGSICFYNSTKFIDGSSSEDVHFSNCRITALRRGPLEVGGTLATREKHLSKLSAPKQAAVAETNLDPLNVDQSVVYDDGEKKDNFNFHDSVATTAPPDSPQTSLQLTKSAAANTTGSFFKMSSPGVTRGGPGQFGNTTRTGFGNKFGASNTIFSGRGGPGAGRLRPSMSDGALRKSGSALCGVSPATQARGFGGDWIPLAAPPPNSEQQFVRNHAIKPLPPGRKNACRDVIGEKECEDFIKM